MRELVRTAACLAAALVGLSGALAQRAPYREPSPAWEGATPLPRDPAGTFDYYLLSLSWSPTYCAGRGRQPDPQCGPRGRPFAFVLHGLWPQFERGWPQDCPSPDRGFVPRSIAERMGDIMPNERLVFHAYRKHGTCSGLGVEGYFALARRLYQKVKVPQRFAAPTHEPFTIAPGELVDAFLAANPGLKADMIAVVCAGPGNRLREVRICFDRGGNFRACGPNEKQSKLCSAGHMYVPPVRPLWGSSTPSEEGSLTLPGPREEAPR